MGGTISATNPSVPTTTQPCVFYVTASGSGIEISSVSVSVMFPGMDSPEVVYNGSSFTGEYDGYSNVWGSATSKGFSILRHNGWRYGTPSFNVQVVFSNGGILNSTGGGATLVGGVGGVTSTELDAVLVTNLLSGAGLPLKMGKVTYTGLGGYDIYRPLTMPSLLTLANGEKYAISGVFLVKSGATIVATIELSNQVLRYATGSIWTNVRNGSYTLLKETVWSTYFTADEHFPVIGENSGVLSIVCRPINSQVVTVEFDGTISANGTDS